MVPLRTRAIDVTTSDVGNSLVADEQVVAGVRAGDRKVFEQLFDRYANALLAFARTQVGSRAVAEEIVQEVFFAIWVGRERWVIKRSVRAYLYQAVYHRALNYFRDTRSERQWVVALDETPEVAWLPSTARTDAPLTDAELRQAIEQAIDKLPEKNRQVFQLVRRQQLSHAEVAEVLGISVKSVEAHIQRAARALRDALAEWRS